MPARGDIARPPEAPADTASLLSGREAWIITDGKPAMLEQATGVAAALGMRSVPKTIAPTGIWKLAAPYGPVAPSVRIGQPGSPLAPPWPAVAIATGRVAIPYIRALRRRAGPATYTIVLQDPRTGPDTADLICVPAHDRRRGPNVVTTLTAPHGYSPVRLAELRATRPAFLDALPGPRIAVLLGGRNGVYGFTAADHARFAGALRALAALGPSFLITPSRRTHVELLAAATEATAGRPRLLWDGSGDNPFPLFIAHADAFVVTADSVNMAGEAAATGRPVWVFEPSAGSAKFRRFHDALRAHGATRPLPDHATTLDGWTYPPLDAAADIAAEVTRRLARRHAMLGGLMRRDGR